MNPLGRLAIIAVLLGGLVGALVPQGQDAVTRAFFGDVEGGVGTFTADVPSAVCAIFWANSTSAKDTLKLTGTVNNYRGCMHSNNDFVVFGGSNVFNRTLRYVTKFAQNENGHVFQAPIVKLPAPEPYPYPYVLSHYAPGGCEAERASAAGEYFTHSGNVQIKAGGNLREGLHYVTGNAVVDTTGFTGRVSIVATGSVKLSTSVEGASYYVDGLLAFANGKGSNTLTYGGNGGRVTGTLYAPQGELSFSGNAMDFTGQVEADRLDVSGQGSMYRAMAPVGNSAC